LQPNQLREHIFSTYISLRFGMAFMSFTFPIVVWIVGLYEGVELQDSLSAYYWASDTSLNLTRSCFVGGLYSFAAFLYLYKGFTPKENIALNLAALLCLGVALVPKQWDCAPNCDKFSWHGVFAVTMFLCLAYVVFFRARDTLQFLPPDEKTGEDSLASTYRRRYQIIGVTMAISPIAAYVLNLLVGLETTFVFFLESAAIWAFAWFWYTKSKEMKISGAVQRALRAELAVPE